MREEIVAGISHWLNCLEKERKYQQELFKSLLNEQPIAKRVEDGFSRFPLNVTDSGFAMGGIPYAILEYMNKKKREDHFQSGMPVRFFSAKEGNIENECRAVVHWKHKNQMKVFLQLRDLPEWLTDGGLGLDVLHDERTFRQMRSVMEGLMEGKNPPQTNKILNVFYGNQFPDSRRQRGEPYQNEALNTSQCKAIENCLLADDVGCIHGPPGTGKTTTLKYLIKELVNSGEQVLVTAPSNAAVDWITLQLQAIKIKVVRVGHLSRVDPEIVDCGLEARVFSQDEAQQIKKVRIQAEDARRQAERYKRNFGPQERKLRRELFRESRELSQWASDIEKRLVEKVLDDAEVICATLSGSDGSVLKGRKFKTCIIDEAAQALQGACWLAMVRAQRVILAGDPFQLPPTVKNPELMDSQMSKTLLDIAISNFPDRLSLLDLQYRMNKTIMEFSNQWFYGKKLTAHHSVEQQLLNSDNALAEAVEFVDTAGCGFEEQQHEHTLSYFNKDEYLILREHLDPLLHTNFIHSPTVGILSPYAAQVRFIREEMEAEAGLPFDLQIKTIDSFQGQEKDVIYLSLVRSNPDQKIGFLKDYRRMNVAMTRAKRKLVIIGDSATLGTDLFYSALLDYIEKKGTYRSAWEFMG
ncbi:MAG: AAA family ATPase [Saprospirales bacterium]|nr:MAG: AAA family ATPase [Saprospirales bacterium]